MGEVILHFQNYLSNTTNVIRNELKKYDLLSKFLMDTYLIPKSKHQILCTRLNAHGLRGVCKYRI